MSSSRSFLFVSRLSVFVALSGDFSMSCVLFLPTPTGVDFAEVEASPAYGCRVVVAVPSAFTAAFNLFLNKVSHLMNRLISRALRRDSFETPRVAGLKPSIRVRTFAYSACCMSELNKGVFAALYSSELIKLRYFYRKSMFKQSLKIDRSN
jgi:hypothetical protein